MRIPKTIEEIVMAMIEKHNDFLTKRDEQEIEYWMAEEELDFELTPEQRYKQRKEWLK